MNIQGNALLYAGYQAQSDGLWPFRTWARWAIPFWSSPVWGAKPPAVVREMDAACRVIELAQITHHRPPWRIDHVMVKGEAIPVTEEVVLTTPFATLLRFRKEGVTGEPKVLVAAPMSGHFATLLRDTVRTTLRDHDVYVTDWHNPRDVPLSAGRFGLDEYTQHLMDFMAALGEGSHLLGVCQPCVSALAATALMAEDGHPATPASLTLMAGPIDCRIQPTEVNRLATSRPIEWFEQNLISTVPQGHPGAGRQVYPGFVQLTAFISMNKDRHVNAFKAYHQHVVDGEFDAAEVLRTFYEEYMAVSDLSADFYLETVQQVFQEYALAKGELKFRDRIVDPKAIRRTALLTVEGERDDICSVGQTMAAQELAPNLKLFMRTHYVQPNVGHYGVFSGRRWQNHIYPLVRNTIHVSG